MANVLKSLIVCNIMDQQLKEIKDVMAKKKRSFYLNVNSRKTQCYTAYTPAIELDGKFKMALVNLVTYYSFPNVDTTNNAIKVYNGTSWTAYRIPEGCYELSDINDNIQSQIGNDNVSFEPNLSTLKTVLTIKNGYQIDLGISSSLATVLGFEQRLYSVGVYESQYIVNILSVSTIKVLCNNISSSYTNGVSENVIYSFFPSVAAGYKIVETPSQLIYLPVTSSRLQDLYVALVDQDNKPLNLRGKEFSIRFHIREG